MSQSTGISILIPTYNGRQRLEKNLPSVIKALEKYDPQGKRSEIIILDDASPAKNIRFSLHQEFPQVKYSRSSQNLRFAKTCNRGVKLAKQSIIILLNDDVRPQENFLLPLVKHFIDPQVFAVGCLEKNLINGKVVLGGRGVLEFKRGLFVHHRAENQKLSNTDWATGGSAAFNKSLFIKFGGFDPLFAPAYWEDIDLSYRAKKLSYQIIFEPKARVEHFHEQTNIQAFGNLKIQIISFRNQLLFVWKNIRGLKLLQHFLWLPYHLVFTSIKSKGKFLLGLFWALSKIPQIDNETI